MFVIAEWGVLHRFSPMPPLAISFALFHSCWAYSPREFHGNIDSGKMSYPTKIDSLSGGHCRGHLCSLVIWDTCDDPVSRPLYRPIMADVHLSGLWLELGHRPSHHHDLFVAHWSDHGQALFTLLCVPRLPPLPQTMATLGGGHPLGSPVCP